MDCFHKTLLNVKSPNATLPYFTPALQKIYTYDIMQLWDSQKPISHPANTNVLSTIWEARQTKTIQVKHVLTNTPTG